MVTTMPIINSLLPEAGLKRMDLFSGNSMNASGGDNVCSETLFFIDRKIVLMMTALVFMYMLMWHTFCGECHYYSVLHSEGRDVNAKLMSFVRK